MIRPICGILGHVDANPGLGAAPGASFGLVLRAARGDRSIRSVAREAGVSEGRWRQIETGAKSLGGGGREPARPRPASAVAMGAAVGLDAATALRAAGFDPADVPAPAPDDDLAEALEALAAAIARVLALLRSA